MLLGDGGISGLEFPRLPATSALHPVQPAAADREEETRESRARAGLRLGIRPGSFSEIRQDGHTYLGLTVLQMFRVGLESV